MLTEKEIITFQDIILAETGKKLSYEEAKIQAQQFYELMILLIVPEEHQYDILTFERNNQA